jgi:HlyD family secretion protein
MKAAESKPDEKAEAKPAPKHARLLVVVLAIAIIAGVGFWLVWTGRIGKKPPPSNSITLYGNVDIRQVELGFRVPGRLKSMRFEEGQSVDAGAVMAELDLRSFDDQLHAAEAQVAENEANLKKVVAGSRPAEIARGKAALDEATAGQQNAQTELERTEKLVADNAIPRANYDTALAASREADARVASANDSLRLLVRGSRAEDIAAARAMLAVAQANLASAQTSLDDARLVAPSDGVVISRVKELGAIVSPNDTVYVVSLTHSVWVRAYVSETQLGKLHPGMDVGVTSDAAPSRSLRGHVGFISPTAEFTPKTVETPELRTDLVYRLRIIVDHVDAGLRQGMPVTVHIATSSGKGA